MDTSKTYNVSARRQDTGKFWGFGNMSYNAEHGNWRLGMKVTPELKALIQANDGKWVNFSFFEKDKKREVPEAAKAGISRLEQSASASALMDDEIPF